MHAKDVIHATLDSSQRILEAYVSDLDDKDLLVPPAEGMNPIAWQWGHLIASERAMVEAIKPGKSPSLPEGFEKDHNRENVASGEPKKFLTKAEYLRLHRAQREVTKAVLDSLSDAELDSPSPERFQRMAPKMGSIFNMAGSHALMHVGQFVSVRRKLGKPVVI